MKNYYYKFILAIIVMICPVVANAQNETFDVDGISYRKLTSNTVEVARVTWKSCGEDGRVTIPSKVTTNGIEYTVTSIGESACDGNVGLVSITLPNSVTSIGENAFGSCSYLEAITMGDNISSIGNHAFSYCSKLRYITIPKSLKTIEEFTFYDCSSLSSVVIPDNITCIKAYAFSCCDNISSLILSKNLESIEMYAFYACNKLQTLEIPNGVQKIGHQAFSCLYSLKSLTIPSSLTNMEGNPFIYDYALTSIKVDEGNKKYDSRDNCNALIQKDGNVLIQGCVNTVIPNSVKKIGQCSFLYCPITKAAIPDGVEVIDYSAFELCENLVSVIIPKSVKRIECTAFRDCKNITSIKVDEGNEYYDSRENCNAIIKKDGDVLVCGCHTTKIPDGIKTIGNYAFYGLKKLTSVAIPNTVESIGHYAFAFAGLTSVVIPGSVKTIGKNAFEGCDALKDVTISEGVNSVCDYAFGGCEALKSICFPNSVTTIGQFALSYCSYLETVKLPDNLKTIERNTFCECTRLESVSIPNSVTTIGNAAFMECVNIRNIKLSENLVTIGDSAFYKAGSQKYYEMGSMTIDFPATLKSIGQQAFCHCNVSSIVVPGSVEKIGRCAFSDISFVNLAEKPQELIVGGIHYDWNFYEMDMHVYEGLKDVYQNSVWGGLVNIIDDVPRNGIAPVIADGSEVESCDIAKLTTFRLLANGNVELNNNMKAKIYAGDKLIGEADINDVTLANGLMTVKFKRVGNQGDSDSFGTVKTKIVIEAGSVNINNEANPTAFTYTYNASKAIFDALPTGINTISTTTLIPQTTKRIVNGRMVIEKGGKLYGIDGKVL